MLPGVSAWSFGGFLQVLPLLLPVLPLVVPPLEVPPPVVEFF
jgi:hypothetical protein